MTKRLSLFVGIVAMAFAGAYYMHRSNDEQIAGRDLASTHHKEKYNKDAPQGLKDFDLSSFNHLAEGSEVYPYEWLMALKSTDKKAGSPDFMAKLDQNFNFIADANPKPYIIPYVGMTTAWSNHPPEHSDAFENEIGEHFRVVNGGIKSVKMVGVNCAACHTGAVTFEGKTYQIDGSSNLINIRNFFKELGKSTLSLFIYEDQMNAFLKKQNVANPEARAAELCENFWTEFDNATGLFGGNNKYVRSAREAFYKVVTPTTGIKDGKIGTLATILHAKYKDTRRLYKGREVVAKSLEKLLRITYGFGENDNIGELKDRMQFLGKLFVGNQPSMKETIAGYGRTDAFGRISNLSLRGGDPVDNTSPVSLPYIWSLKYTAMLHYTANSNSVTMRNVGESIGLGSLILDNNFNTTSNMHNLERLEKLAYSIKVPQWESIFRNVPKLKPNYQSAEQGKIVYQQNCMTCHTAEPQKVGPSKQLNSYKLYSLAEMGTDDTSARNNVVPIGKVKFKDSIFQAMTKVKNAYYAKNNISSEQQAVWEARDIRGPEFFRDTLLGETNPPAGAEYAYLKETGMGYRARHLSGVWATGPFLHNGSVPTIDDLLKTASERPKIFKVVSRELDPAKLGVHSETSETKCDVDDETCFDTTLVGNRNTGHEYGTHLKPEEKLALIEYLKVLAPEPEYSW